MEPKDILTLTLIVWLLLAVISTVILFGYVRIKYPETSFQEDNFRELTEYDNIVFWLALIAGTLVLIVPFNAVKNWLN